MHKINPKAFKQIVKNLPDGTTQEAFAKDLGITQPQVSRYCRGKTGSMGDDVFEKLAEYLGKTVEQLSVVMASDSGSEKGVELDKDEIIYDLKQDKIDLRSQLKRANAEIDRLRRQLESSKKAEPLSNRSAAK